MPAIYNTAKVTVIVGGPQEVGIDVRALLPAASGSPTIEVMPAGVRADWPDGLIRPATEETVLALATEYMNQGQPRPVVPKSFNAATVAAGLVETIRRIRTERMGAFSAR